MFTPTGPKLSVPTIVAKVLLLSYTANTRRAEKTRMAQISRAAVESDQELTRVVDEGQQTGQRVQPESPDAPR